MAVTIRRTGLVRAKRKRLNHCEAGDIVEFECGSIFLVTSWFNGGIGGRLIVMSTKRVELDEGELECPPDQPITLREDLMEARREYLGMNKLQAQGETKDPLA